MDNEEEKEYYYQGRRVSKETFDLAYAVDCMAEVRVEGNKYYLG